MVATTPCTSEALSLGGSSIYGGQGVDLVSMVGTVVGSTVGGNLGTDTLEFQNVVKESAVYGGGGFRMTPPSTALTASALVRL